MMHTVRSMPDAMFRAYERFIKRLEPRLHEACTRRDADLFVLRVGRSFADFYRPFMQVYGSGPDVQQHLDAIGDVLLDAYLARPEALRLIDLERQMTPDWFQHQQMLGYVCYTDLFAGTLPDITDHLDYLQELGVTYLHLMPLLEPRPGISDGGYAVMSYHTVAPSLGTMRDLADLATQLHERGISLCIDLVINHTASEHEWAQRAMAGEQQYMEYYFTFADRTLPAQYETTLREVFPDFAPGNFTWFEAMAGSGRWVWTTFNRFQWDLNYRNPAVFREMLDIMCFLGNQGADVLRLDAIPFIWKEMGTDCENQPETHLLVQAFRAAMRIVAPGIIFKAEAIVPPEQLVPYLGIGKATGKACELAYHNQLMVLLWSTLASRDVRLMTHALHNMPPTPPGATWLTYVRNHDDIGWAVTDQNAGAVGLNGFLHRQFLNDFYSGKFAGSFAAGALFQFNPLTLDARISGTAASLAGMERATVAGDFLQIGLAVRRLLLLHSIIMAFGGIPLLYMGDEVGLLNDHSYRDNAWKARDNRWMHRPAMNWEQAHQRRNLSSVAGQLYTGLRQLIVARKHTAALHGPPPHTQCGQITRMCLHSIGRITAAICWYWRISTKPPRRLMLA
ncbi:MAG: alpha-amylase [Chloroflexaceae bacterium]|nr:alpha-amylase [Chloroflexaceae bacterium]